MITFGYDSAGRDIPTETQTTNTLTAQEENRLSQDPNAAGGFVPYRSPNASADDVNKPTDDRLAANNGSTSAQTIYGAGGPFIANFTQGQNPLHDYASYVYNISLHACDKGTLQAIMEGGPNAFAPSNTIIHTSGGYRDSRNPYFNEDFFIDNLEMECTIAPSDVAKSTNAFFLKFKIIEPMGMTLMNRIVAMADGLGVGASWTQIPYVIMVEFTGYLDDGSIVSLPSQRKIIPIKITNILVRPTAKGTDYDVEAVVFAHEAYNSEVGTAPAAFESEARTLEDFFRLDEKAGVDKDGRPIAATETLGGEKEKVYKVRSFVSAYNNYQKELVKNERAKFADKVKVVFAKEILEKMQLVDGETQQADRTASPDRERKKVAGKQSTGADPGGPKPTVGVFSFQAGDSMPSIIDAMMMQTKFWRSQVAEFTKDKEKTISPSGVVKGWKIVPEVKLINWDETRGRYAYEVTYYVKVHVKYNREDPNLPKAWPKGVARTYEYQYTGQNRDVLQWDVKFDTAYFSKELVYPTKNSAIAGPQPQESQTDKLEASKKAAIGRSVAEGGGGAGSPPNNEVNPRVIQKTSNVPMATGTNAMKDGVGMVAANAFDNIYNRMREMCAAEVVIVGDPALIVQEEVAKNAAGDIDTPSSEYVAGSVSDATGGVSVNNGEVHCRLIWKAPTDLVEESGGYGGNGGFNQVVLNGLWRMTILKHIFTNGIFTTKFECIRLFEQEEELGKASSSLGLTSRDLTVFPPLPQTANAYTFQTTVKQDITDTGGGAENTSLSVSELGIPSDGLRQSQSSFQIFGVNNVNENIGQRYDIPTSLPNPAVDPFNLPTGVVIDPATGLPNYQGAFYTGGQKDIAAWKAAVDAKQPFSYTNTKPNGNTGIDTFTPA